MPPDEPHGLLLARPGARVLLVGSGVHEPRSRLPAVPAVERTVADLGRCLIERAELDPAHLTTLLNPRNPEEFGSALVEVVDQADDVLMFYYVGHGLVSPRGELHLGTRSTIDLAQGIASHQALPYSTISEVLSGCRAELMLVVLDCCFSGRAQAVPQPGLDQVFAAARHGSYVLAAAGRDEAAWAPDGERHTAFSGALITLLAGGDQGAGPYLTVDDVHRSLSRTLGEQGLPAPRRQATGFADRQRLTINPARSSEAGEQVGEVSPYPGLASFGPQDADVFFGRTELIGQLVDRVAGQLTRQELLMVVGPSGAGKSSLLRAGLVPALERAAGTGVVVLTPGQDPVGVLAERFAPLAGCLPGELRESLMADPGRLRGLLEGPGQRVLIVDQFEELFTQCKDESWRRAFLAVLHATCAAAVVVIGVRADFFGRCVGYAELAPGLQRPVVVTPMTVAQLRAAIEEPARVAGLTVQPALVDLLLEDVGVDLGVSGPANVLPLLSHVLLATWQRREGGMLTVGGYLATGGVSRALARTADQTLAGLDLPGQRAIRHLLPRLVRLGEGADDTRIRIPLDDMLPSAGERDETWQALDRFVGARLLTVDANTIEISHEALIRAWPRLREWINVNRATLLARQQLDRQARSWADHQEDPSYLYAGTRLAGAEEARVRWEADPAGFPPLSERSARFLQASVQARERAKRARRWGIGSVAVSLTLALLASIGIAVNALSTARDAERQRLAALSQRVAAQSLESADTDPELARLLAATAFTLSRTPEASYGLARAWASPHRKVLSTVVSSISALAMGQFNGKPVIISGGGFSDSGRGKVVIWDATDGRRLHVMDAAGAVSSVAMGQLDGRPVIISGGASETGGGKAEGRVEVWDAADGRRLRVMAAPGWVSSVAMGQFDGKPVIISGGGDGGDSSDGDRPGKVQVWDAASGRQLHAMIAAGEVFAVAMGEFNGEPAIITGGEGKFSGAGESRGGVVQIWDAASGRLSHELPAAGHVSALVMGEFNGGPAIISGGDDVNDSNYGRVEIWDAVGGRRLHKISTADSVSAVAMGRFNGAPAIITGSGNRNTDDKSERRVEVWDAATGGRLLRTMDAVGGVSAVVMGQYAGEPAIITGSGRFSRGDVEIWDATGGQQLHGMAAIGWVSAVAMGQYGGRPAIIAGSGAGAGGEGRVEAWDTAGGRHLLTTGVTGGVSAVTMGQYGGKPAIIAGGVRRSGDAYKGRVEVWDATDGHHVHGMDAAGWVSAVAMGRFNGRSVIISGSDSFVDGVGRVEIWDAADGRRLHEMDAADAVSAVTMGQFDGKPVIISGGDDGSGRGRVEVWDAADGHHVHGMDAADSVSAVAMGQFNGRPAIISGGGSSVSGDRYEGGLEIWDAAGGRRLHVMEAAGGVFGVAMGRFNGKTVIISGGADAASDKGKVEIWDAAGGQRLHAMETADTVFGVTVGQFGGRPAIISGSHELLQAWDTTLPADLLQRVCAQTSRALTPDEWTVHVGTGDAYQRVCAEPAHR